MSVTVKSIMPDSIAEEMGFEAGDKLLSINGNDINDVLDYQFYCNDEELILVVQSGSDIFELELEKDAEDDLGLEFETYLMDAQHTCQNDCIFCFVDQMPKGMRSSLYFKDDDSRLSFLFGNYVTLTNMKQADIDRIIKMHISPINISVHTTNPALRCRMMGNRFAGEKLDYVRQLAKAGIKINAQIVLCKGINDGEELKRTMADLGTLYPSVSSVAVVPVGLTAHRDNLYHLDPFEKEDALEVLDIIHSFTDEFMSKNGTRLIYPSDEFFVLAQKKIPGADYYGDFEQLENGVGMTALLLDEFESEYKHLKACDRVVAADLVSGELAAPLIEKLAAKLKQKYPNLTYRVHPVKNDFFGGNVTVAGLVTGRDIIAQLQGDLVSDRLIVPACMLRHEQDKFLDDTTIPELESALGVTVQICENDGYSFITTVLEGE